MRTNDISGRARLVGLAIAVMLLTVGLSSTATGYATEYCAGVPIVQGTPPWGFHTGQPITGPTGSYGRGHGDYNFANDTVSGVVCQANRYRNYPDSVIVATVLRHMDYHSHYAYMWGYEGNIMKIHIRVTSSSDKLCKVGTIGRMTLFGSYNNVRQDSVQFFFPKACKAHDHLYHGPQVNDQVPPL